MNMLTLKLTQELSRFDEALKKEWLVTNGLGGYASSTVLGVNTRKYHGLLVAALHPPADRTVCLSKLDEEIYVDNKVYLLGANEFQGAMFPKGFIHLEEFSVSPFPKYLYSIGNIEVQKTIFMLQEKNATLVVYKVKNDANSEVKVRLFPLVTCRHFHSVIDRSTNSLDFTQQHPNLRDVQLIANKPKASIAVRATSGKFHEKPNWIERLLYREEAMRGESSIDDCYQPGYYELQVPKGSEEEFAIIATADEHNQRNAQTLNEVGTDMSDVTSTFKLELEQHNSALTAFYGSYPAIHTSDWLSWLLFAADAFTVKSLDDKKSVIAGYPWFETWGRDTFISLPGLMLLKGRFEDARSVFSQFNAHCEKGLIPNFLADQSGQAAYNTVDATLWYVNSVLQYLKYTKDFEFVQNQLWNNLKEVIEWHIKGTHFGINVDNGGLLTHGERLTWMDAEADGKAVTPRAGKAVEIQALWYNALRTGQMLADRFGENNLAETYTTMADKCKVSFNKKFWNNTKGYLFDVVGSFADASLRPNQIFAASLDFTMLGPEKNKQIVDLVQRELVTPYGLRTLERADPKYKGACSGDRKNRDVAYHNGTVWPWLLGPFMSAFRKTKGYTDQNPKLSISSFVWPLFTRHITQAGLGTLSEIFDGDQPHTPRGCIAQAWSVAEPLRAYVEDALQVRPKYEKEVLGV